MQLETFIDPYELNFLSYSEDPIPNFHKLMENYTSGYLTVPVVGAGTANTEFEVLTGMGIINGYEDDSFKPQQSITRAEVAAMIYRVAPGDVEDEKADINAGAKIFTDVDADDWYAGYVNYCGDAEYNKGFEDDSFRADENVTGYQVLAMILRAVGYD